MASARFTFRFAIQQASDTEKKWAHFRLGIGMIKNSWIYFAILTCVCAYVCIDIYEPMSEDRSTSLQRNL